MHLFFMFKNLVAGLCFGIMIKHAQVPLCSVFFFVYYLIFGVAMSMLIKPPELFL